MKHKRKKYSGVHRRGENAFRINYYGADGGRKYETVEAQSEGEAFAIRLQRLAAGSGKPQKTVAIDDITLDGAFRRYSETESAVLKERTRQRSTCIYNHFVEYLGLNYPSMKFVAQVTEEIGNRYKDYLLAQVGAGTKTASGINSDITKLRAIFACYCRYNFIKENVFKKVKKIPRRQAKPEKKHLPSDQEISLILDAAKGDPSYEEIVHFLIRVGRRIEETSKYEKKDVTVDEAGKPVRLKIREEITKTDEENYLYFDDELAEIIRKAMAKNPGCKYLFTNKHGRKIARTTFAEHFLDRVCEEKGIQNRITPHCFRYYVVNALMEAGIKFIDAMKITGHVDLESFLSYQQATTEGVQKALAVTRIKK